MLAVPSHENRALLDRALLESIRPGAALILVSRAHLVDFDALTEFLHAGRFRAAIDVFPQEPLDPAHPIRRAPNVVISAHRAGTVKEALWEIGEMVLDDLEAIANGMPPQRMQRAEPGTLRPAMPAPASRGTGPDDGVVFRCRGDGARLACNRPPQRVDQPRLELRSSASPPSCKARSCRP